MMIPSNYAINISRKDGDRKIFGTDTPATKWFATVELGMAMQAEAFRKLDEFRERFPAPEWRCTLSFVECTGHEYSDDEVEAYKEHAAKA